MLNPENLRKYSSYISLSSEIVAALIIPSLAGIYLDKHADTGPWGVLIGTIVGFLGVFGIIYRVLYRTHSQNPEKRKRNEQE